MPVDRESKESHNLTPIPLSAPFRVPLGPDRVSEGRGERVAQNHGVMTEQPGVRFSSPLRILVVLVLLLTAVMIGKYLHNDYKDAEVWYDAGRRVLSGQTLTQLPHYRYPPTFAVMVAPLAALGFPAFFFIWYGTNLILFGISLRLTHRLTFGPSQSDHEVVHQPTAVSTFRFFDSSPIRWPAVLVAVFAIDNLLLGQTNILIMALVYWAFLEDMRGRQWRAGVPLAAAITIKIFPLPLLAYFLYRRRLGVVAAGLLWSAFFLFLLPVPARGFQRNVTELRDWSIRVAMPFVSHGRAGDWGQHSLDLGNQSLPAVARRFLTKVNAQVAAREERAFYVNIVDLSEHVVNVVVLVISSLFVVAFVFACGWRATRDRTERAVEYSLATILLLLTSALSWTYFFVMLLLPASVAVRLVKERGQVTARTTWALWAALFGLGAVTPLLISQYARALGCLFWVSLLLYGALSLAALDLRRAQRQKQRQEEIGGL